MAKIAEGGTSPLGNESASCIVSSLHSGHISAPRPYAPTLNTMALKEKSFDRSVARVISLVFSHGRAAMLVDVEKPLVCARKNAITNNAGMVLMVKLEDDEPLRNLKYFVGIFTIESPFAALFITVPSLY
jgi:hypothetical protein